MVAILEIKEPQTSNLKQQTINNKQQTILPSYQSYHIPFGVGKPGELFVIG